MNRVTTGRSVLALGLALGCAACPSERLWVGSDVVETGGTIEPTISCSPRSPTVCVCATGGLGTRDCIDGLLSPVCSNCADVASGGRCATGRYVGEMLLDSYYPQAASACEVQPLFGGMNIVVEIAFSLSADGEFVTVVEPVSCLTARLLEGETNAPGSPMPPASPDPVQFGFAGQLDCGTGVFSGEIRGAYYSGSVCGLGQDLRWYSAKGRLSGLSDTSGQRLEGVVEIQETPGPLDFLLGPGSGGTGTWWAQLDPLAAAPEPVADCLDGAPFTDFELLPRAPSDAGMP